MKWNEDNVPDQTGRTAVITGANTGLGYETARVLAQRGATVVLAVRNTDKGEQAAAAIREQGEQAGTAGEISVLPLDLGSLESVQGAAAELHDRVDQVDLLINNAGVMYPPKQTTRDGFELQFGTNHLGHFAWTAQTLDLVLPVKDSRVVTVASIAHKMKAKIQFDDLQWESRKYDRVAAYGQSKLANLMFGYELHRRLQQRTSIPDGTTTISAMAHPGVSNTELMRHLPEGMMKATNAIAPLFLQPPKLGALPSLRAATDPAVLGGQYYGPTGPGEIKGHPEVVASSPQSYDLAIQRRLWEVSEELTGVTFPL